MKGHRVMVRDLTTGKVYSSMREASLYMPVCQESLSDAYSTKKSECCGIPVEFINGSGYGSSKAVKCLETGKVYRSALEAGKAVNRHSSSINNAIKRSGRCAGYHWKYI